MIFPYKIIDLTHTLDEQTPSWSGGCGFNIDVKLDYSDCRQNEEFRVQQFKMHAGIGILLVNEELVDEGQLQEELGVSKSSC